MSVRSTGPNDPIPTQIEANIYLSRALGDDIIPPQMVDVPHLQSNNADPDTAVVGNLIVCTTGNWVGAPTGYAYEWHDAGGVVAGMTTNQHVVIPGDIGRGFFAVVVIATNAHGVTRAQITNQVFLS